MQKCFFFFFLQSMDVFLISTGFLLRKAFSFDTYFWCLSNVGIHSFCLFYLYKELLWSPRRGSYLDMMMIIVENMEGSEADMMLIGWRLLGPLVCRFLPIPPPLLDAWINFLILGVSYGHSRFWCWESRTYGFNIMPQLCLTSEASADSPWDHVSPSLLRIRASGASVRSSSTRCTGESHQLTFFFWEFPKYQGVFFLLCIGIFL